MYDTLKKEMKEQGVTTYRLAKNTNIVPSDLYAAFKGHKDFYPHWRRRIAEALNKPEETLFPSIDFKGNDQELNYVVNQVTQNIYDKLTRNLHEVIQEQVEAIYAGVKESENE